MELSDEQRVVLNHVVMDADEWLTNAINGLGENKAQEALIKKVERWEPEYLAEKARLGENYKTRAERDKL